MKKECETVTIKEVSQKYNISSDTLRYYERVGMIPPVTRRHPRFGESDLGWVELALCMRGAGLPVEAMIEYVKLCQQGDSTIEARMLLLKEQMETLLEQKAQIESTIKRLDFKISRYEEAVKTGKLTWE